MWSKWWSLGLLILGAGCFQSRDNPPAPGGETHFLRDCNSTCGAGLSCLCGVCTRTCDADSACKDLGSNASCIGNDAIGDTRSCAPSKRTAAKTVCDARCTSNADCGDGLRCQAGLCREPQESVSPTGPTGPSGPMNMSEPTNAPVVLLLVDTSGSQADMPGCTCASPTDCTNCSPDCSAGQQNRWFTMLAALTGSYADFGCQALPRTSENGATYDENYSIPNYVLSSGAQQRDDGLIAAYASRIQFGLATFDAEYTYKGGTDLLPPSSFDFDRSAGVNGMFSYGGGMPDQLRQRPDGTTVGRFFYPGCKEPYFVDSGIRSAAAAEGALTLPGLDLAAAVRSQQLQEQLRSVRPYGGAPIAAALDDLYVFFTADVPADSRKRHVVLLTDGAPDTDFRSLGCDCSTVEECNGEDPSRMSCPYPTAPAAARHLRCGFGADSCAGPIDKVHVIALSTSEASHDVLNSLAAEGGSTRAKFVENQSQLRDALRAVFDAALADR